MWNIAYNILFILYNPTNHLLFSFLYTIYKKAIRFDAIIQKNKRARTPPYRPFS